jgi:hypothetical protein
MPVLLNYPLFHADDNDGAPLTGGLLYSYISGSTTNKATYSDRDMAVAHANANPVVLDARGEAVIYGAGLYKLILRDSDGTLIWTQDEVQLDSEAGAYTFFVDPSETDHGAAGNGSSLYDVLIANGASKKYTVRFHHNGTGNTTDYAIGTTFDASTYTNVTFEFENGARLAVATGITLTLPNPSNILAQPSQQIVSGLGSLRFGDGGVFHPGWWGAKADGTTDDYDALNACMAAIKACDTATVHTPSELSLLPGCAYLHNTGLFFGASGVNTGVRRIVGNQSRLIGSVANGIGWDFTGLYGYSVEGITFEGDTTNVLDIGILMSRRATGVSSGVGKFYRVNMIGTFGKFGVYNYGTETNTWLDSWLYVTAPAVYVQSKDNTTYSITIPNGTGLGSESISDNHFIRTKMYNLTATGASGTAIAEFYSPITARIQECFFDVAGEDYPNIKFAAETGSDITDISIIGSTFHGKYLVGVQLAGDIFRCRIVGNRFQNQDAFGTDIKSVAGAPDFTDCEFEAQTIDFSAATTNLYGCNTIRLVRETATFSISGACQADLYYRSDATVTLTSPNEFTGTKHITDTGDVMPTYAMPLGTGFGKSIVTHASLNFNTADTQTLWSLTLAAEESITLRAYVNGKRANTTHWGMFGKTALGYRSGAGAATLQGGSDISLFADTVDGAGLDAEIDVATNDIRIRVTNADAESTRWIARIEYELLSS